MKKYINHLIGSALVLGAMARLHAQAAPAVSAGALNSILSPAAPPVLTVGAGAATVGHAPATAATPLSVVSAASLGVQKASSLNLTVDETDRVFSVSVSNPAKSALTVLGVQSTTGLYIVSFPTAIPAGGSAAFNLLYYSQPGVSSTSDLLRVLTDRGPITVEVDHGRQAAVALSATMLHWNVGEAASAKSVQLTAISASAVPKAALAFGSGNSAQLVPDGNGVYTIKVTPGSTAKVGSFPVMIQFQTALPDQAPVITCSVDSN